GLGESAHGSESLGKLQFSFVKDLVMYQQCTLVLLEIPFDTGLLFDLHIQGLTTDKGIIEGYLKQFVDGGSTVFRLLTWLRDYNKTADRKVHVLGVDNSSVMPCFALMDYYSEILGPERAAPYLYNIYAGNI